MDILLLILGGLAILTGIAGCVLPLLPGPPLAWVGLLLLHFSKYAHLSVKWLLVTGVSTAVVVVADLFLPSRSARHLGGTKAGGRGAAIGMVAGLLIGPWGIVLGPLLGAFGGEFLVHPHDLSGALKAAWGSLAGVLLGTGTKLIWCLMMAWWFVQALLR